MPNSTLRLLCVLSPHTLVCEGATDLDTTLRTLVKAILWQLLGFAFMTLTAWIFTGSVAEGGAIAVTATILGFVSYFLYERLWSRVHWGRIDVRSSRERPALLDDPGVHVAADEAAHRDDAPVAAAIALGALDRASCSPRSSVQSARHASSPQSLSA